MGDPLLAPAPAVLPLLGIGLGEKVDVFFVIEACGDAVADASEGIWKVSFVFWIVAPETVEHAGIEGIEAEDPIQLVCSILLEAVLQARILRDQRDGQSGGCGQGSQAGILALPPVPRLVAVR